jgi:hypothetical protein
VEDRLTPAGNAQNRTVLKINLHWLVGDWPWTLEEDGPVYRLRLESPQGIVKMAIEAVDCRADIRLVRAGELLEGTGPADPTHGWASLTYASRQPALSIALLADGKLPMGFVSRWSFDD